ncbi:MAG: hypothetical protein K2H36_06165 [Clostridia bacterium]|nr:hypothetical protein [Clostridia bacterium]
MKKSKLITALLLVVILLVAMMSVFAACDPKEDPNGGQNGNGTMPVPPPTPIDPVDPTEPTIYYESMELLEKIIGAIETPEKVLGIDFELDFTAPDGKKTTIAFKGNLYDKYRNELSFIVYQQIANQETRERVFGIYMVNDKMYVDLGEGKSLLYLEDFNPNYMVSLIESAIGKLPDLIGGIGDTISTYLPLIMMILFQAPVVEVTEEGGQNISMVFDVKGLLDGIPNLLNRLPFTLPVDVGPFLSYLSGLMPNGVYKLQSNFDADGKLIFLGVNIDDNAANEHTSLVIDLDIKDTAVDTYIPEIDESALVNFSLTNIQFSIDLLVGTQMVQKVDENNNPVVDAEGNPVMENKRLDVGLVLNQLLGSTGLLPDFRLPAGMLLLEGGTGLRLSFALDLDLNYKKEPVDKNKIAIELYLLKQDGTLADGEGSRPQAGIYYTEGSLYINLDNLLPNYMQNINLRVDTNLSTLVSALVDMITGAIDGALGTDFRDIVDNSGASVEKDGSVTVYSQNDLEKILATANAEVIALSSADNGKYVINAGFKNFIDALTQLVGFKNNIRVEDSQIIITANDKLIDAIGSLIGKDLGFSFPAAIPEVNLTINLFEGGLESIAVDATIDSTLDLEVKIHQFYICYEDPDLDKRIEEGINKENTSYINSLSGVIDTLLSGIIIRTHFSMTFNEGRYNLAPFIASFGLPQIADTDIIWEFTDQFVLDASLNIQIALDRANPSESTFLFELKAEDDIRVGEGDEGVKFAKDTVLLGIYGYRNSVYIDLSNFKIANITLPKLKFDLRFSQVIFSLIDDMIAQLLTSMKIEGGDLIFNFDLGSLIGLSSAPSTDGAMAMANGNAGQATLNEELAAIILGVNSEAITPMISMASILAVINMIDPDIIDETLAEALGLMEIKLETSMGRKDGFKFEFTGNLIPVMIDYQEENGIKKDSICVFYYDEKGEQLPTHDENGKKIVYQNTDKDNKAYAYKKYNYINANGVDTGFKLLFEAGTADYPIVVGKIPDDKKFNFAAKALEFEQYKSDLIQAIMDTVGTGSLDLTLTLLTKDNKMDLQRMINTILASVGKRFEVPITLNLDEWETDVKLLLQWDIDLTNSVRSAIKLEMQYRGKVVLGVYIYRNSLIINLEGLGLFSAELVNSNIISKVFGMIDGYVKQIQGFDLNEIIGDLLEQAGLPTLPGAGSTEGDIATDDNIPTIGENLQVMDLVKYLLSAVSLEDTSIALNFTSTLINTLLNELLGINLGIDFTLDGKLDLFGNEFGIDVGVQDIEVKAKLELNVGGEVDIRVDYENIADWDATSGRTLAKTMLDNLDIGLTIDLANNTSDANSALGSAGYTRIRIWRAGNDDRMVGADGEPRIPKGNIVVGVYQIDKTLFNDNTANGSSKAIAYVVLDYDAGQIKLTLATKVVEFFIDFGTVVKDMAIDLDLLGTLGDLFDGLFTQLDDMFDNMSSQTDTQALATADGEGGNNEPSIGDKFKELLKDFDVVKLLSRGIEVSLRSNGNFNVDVEFDPYTINNLIDTVLGAIFSKGTGKESLLNLKALVPDMFSQDYLSNVAWTRMIPGSDNNTDSFWGSLRSQLSPLLQDVVKAVGYGGVSIFITDTLLNNVYTQVSRLIRPLIPFAVFNEFHVGVNVVDATLANIYVIGDDHNDEIYDYDGNLAYGASSARTNGYFTQIWIYNMFKAVGDPSNAIPGVTGNDAQGSVTWSDIPSRIDYAPYTYTNDDDGAEEIYNKHFKDKDASYQDGASGAIIKKSVSFYLKRHRYDENSAWIDYSVNSAGNPDTLVTQDSLAILKNKGIYVIEARATFGTITRTMEITINALGDGGGIERVESFSLHAYDVWPDFITVRMKDGSTRKISTERLDFLNEDKTGAAVPKTFKEDNQVNAWVHFPREDQADMPVTINFIDSTIDQAIIDGEAISAKDGQIPRLIIDLYEYELTKESSIRDYISDVFYFKYKDGMAVGLDINGDWDVSAAENSGFYDRVVDEDGLSRNVDGTAFIITTTIGNADNNTLQNVSLMVWIKTKKVSKLTINGLENTLRIDPYQYYMYLITGDEQYNPFPTTALANYNDVYASPIDPSENIIDNNDGIAEEVYISWNEDQYKNIDFGWNNNNAQSTPVSVSLDNSKYSGNFTWTFDTEVVVMRNEVQAVYFDEALTQSTYFIDPFEYLLRKEHGDTDQQIYPQEAWVVFTNGSVFKMPIQWIGLENFNIIDYSSKFGQLQVKIGYDVTGDLASKIVGDLEQMVYVNVRVENLVPDGIDVAGSEYSVKHNGETTFYIDPIQVLYYGMDPFPSTVTMVYMSKKESELEVNWEFDRSLITMDGRKDLTAYVVISEEYKYPINVEIIDRTNLKVAVESMDIDPYKYTIDENGSRVYSNFATTGYVYKVVGDIDFSDLENIKANGLKTVSGNVSEEFDTYVQYEVVYTKNSQESTYTTRYFDMIEDFFAREGSGIEVKSAVIKEYFNVNVDWDLTEINYAISDVYTVKMISKALDSKYDRTFRVNVNVVAKKVDYVGTEGYYVQIMQGGSNLSEEELLTTSMTRNLYVAFTDGTYGTYECTIDLLGVNMNYYDVQSVERFEVDGKAYYYRDRNGAPVSDEDLANIGTDVTLTVCSGDIAQRITIKAVVVLSNSQTA